MTALQASLGAPTQWDAVAQEPYFTYTDTAGASRTPPITPTHRACRGDSAWRAPQDSASASGASATKTRRHGTFPRSIREAHRRACSPRSCWRSLLGGYFVLLAGIVWFIKSSYLPALWLDPLFGLYSLCVTVYLLSRFSLSLLYRPSRRGPGQLPTVAVVIPAMNEQTAIETTLASIFALDYPQHLLSVFAVDDGSTDATWERMAFAARRFPNLHAIRFSHNRGKRAAMAAGIRATDAEIVCFVDSDSTLEPDALREIIKPFRDHRVAAVTGHADVQNRAYNVLTLLQQVRYFVAFRVIKGSESIFGCRDLRLGLLLRLPPRPPARGAAGLGDAVVPRPRGDVRRRPRAHQHAAQALARRLPVDRALRHERAARSSRASSCSRRAGRRAGCASR